MKVRKTVNYLLSALLFLLLITACQQPVDPVGGEGNSSGKTAAPTFSIAPGTYTTSQQLKLSCSTGGATIYYKVNGGAQEIYSDATPIELPGFGKDYTITAYAEASGSSRSDTVTGLFKITGTITLTFDVTNVADVEAGLDYPKIMLYCTADDGSAVPDTTDDRLYIKYTENSAPPALIPPENFHYDGTPFSTRDDSPFIYLTDSLVIKAIAYKKGWVTSAEQELKHPLKLKEPVFVPGDTEPITETTEIRIESPIAGSSIYYVKAGYNDPLDDSTADVINLFTPFSITEPAHIKAITKKANWKTSNVTKIKYRLKLPKVQFTPAPVDGTIYTSSLNIAMSCPTTSDIPGLKVKYTTNGGDPSSDVSAQVYTPGTSSAIIVSKSTTIKAYAFIDGDEKGMASGWHRSDLESATYNYEIKCPYPNTAGGTFSSKEIITLTSDTPDVDIYYLITADPSADLNTVTGTKYSVGFDLDPSAVGDPTTDIAGKLYLKARAYRKDSTSDFSTEMFESYIFKLGAPVLPANKSAQASFNITLNHNEPGVTIKYTKDLLANPTTEAIAGAVLAVNETMDIKAIATKKHWASSNEVIRKYTLKPMSPIFFDPYNNDKGGLVVYREEIQLKAYDPNTDATIFLTKDGSDPKDETNPNRFNFKHNDMVDIKKTANIRAVCHKSGWGYSDETVGLYELKVKEPEIDRAAGDYNMSPTLNFKVTSLTNGAIIHCTTNGADPSTDTNTFTNSKTFDLDKNMTVRIIAKKDGWTPSDEVTAVYTVKMYKPDCNLTERGGSGSQYISEVVTEDQTNDIITTTYIYELNDTPLGTVKLNYSGSGALVRYTTDETTDGATKPTPTVGILYNLIDKPNISIDESSCVVQSLAYSLTGNYQPSNLNQSIYKFKVKQPSFSATGELGSSVGTATTKLYKNGAFENVPADTMKIIGNKIKLNDTTVNSIIHYKIVEADGVTVFADATTDANTVVDVPVDSSFTITMYATRDRWLDSEPITRTFCRQLEMPVITHDLHGQPASLVTEANMSISAATGGPGGEEFYFTVANGTTTPADPETGAKFSPTLGKTTTTKSYRAVAVKEGWLVSDITAKYTIYKCTISGTNFANNYVFSYTVAGKNVSVNASSGSGLALKYAYNGGALGASNTFNVGENETNTIIVSASGSIASDPYTVSHKVRLNSPTFNIAASTPVLYSSRTITISPAAVKPSGTSVLYSITTAAPGSTVVGNTITLSTNPTTTVKLLSRGTGYNDSTIVDRTYTLKLDPPTYIGKTNITTTTNVGGVSTTTVTGRKLQFKLPGSYPSGSVVEFSTNNSTFVPATSTGGGFFYYNVGVSGVRVYARVVKTGYTKSDSMFVDIPAH